MLVCHSDKGSIVVVSFYVNVSQVEFTLEEGTSTERIPLSDCSVGKPVVHFLDCSLMWEGPGNYGQWYPWSGYPECRRK